MSTTPHSLLDPLTTALLSQKHLPASPTWLSSFLCTQKPTAPLPILLPTATFRILHSDIRTTLSITPSSLLPENIGDASIQERRLPSSPGIVVQILDMKDVGRSLWEQVEEAEMVGRGEARGKERHEIVRAVALPGNEEGEDGSGRDEGKKGGSWKYLLQDAGGRCVWGFEMDEITGGKGVVVVGSKMLLKGAVVARGVVLLERKSVGFLGGKVEGWEREWREGKEGRLRAEVEEMKTRAGEGGSGG